MHDQSDISVGDQEEEREPTNGLDEFFHQCLAYRSGGEYLEALQFVSRFTKYAPLNAFLIYAQRPTATFVATSSRWRSRFGRKVKCSARPIVILAPNSPVTFVYDVEDTTGKPLPAYFHEPFKVKGYLEAEVWKKTVENCEKRDRIRIDFTEKSALNAGCIYKNSMIGGGTVPAGMPKYIVEIGEMLFSLEEKYTTLVHELAHLYCGHLGGDEDGWWPDRRRLTLSQREIEAESVCFIVAQRAGMETKSVGYLAGYFREHEKDLATISIKRVLEVATYIVKMGKESLALRKKQS